MITHYIYHIPGVKVGCARNLEKRKLWYSRDVSRKIKILEILYDKTDQEAGDIEWAWADRFGYKRGNHYVITITTMKKSPSEWSKFGRKAGRRAAELGKTGFQTMSMQEVAAKRWAKMSSEQKFSIVQKAGLKAGELGHSGCQKRAMCPHCGLESSIPVLSRWHFNNCPHKNRIIK